MTPQIIVATSILVLCIDLLWIKIMMKNEYENLIPNVQKSKMNVRPIGAFLSYVTIILPLLLFTLPNIRSSHRITDSMFYGGVLGCLMYGMFSFTNYALLDEWTLRVVALDTIWGFVLYTIVSYVVSFMILNN